MIEKKYIEFPKFCPYCGHPVEYTTSPDGTETVQCSNEHCSGRIINELDYFCGKKGLNILHISTAILEDLIDFGFIKNRADIFSLFLHKDELVKKDGYGVRGVNRILRSIETARTTTLDKFIASLGINLIGTSVSKELCRCFETYEDFRCACKTNYPFENLPTFGEAKANSLRNYDFTEADEIYKYLTVVNPYYVSEEVESPLKDMTIVITGGLHLFENREELKRTIEQLGGKVSSSVSKNTSYLINNDITSTSGKNKKAKEIGIPIIEEEEFVKKFIEPYLK